MSLFDTCPDRKDSHSFKYSRSVMKARLGRSDLEPLWVADMDFPCPEPVVSAIKKRAEHPLFGYTTMADDPEIPEALTRWLLQRFQWEAPQEWVLYSPGVVNSMYYLVASLCNPGDRVLLQNPVYPPFRNLVKDAGCQWVDNRLVWNEETRRYDMDLEDLEKKAADPLVKLMLLCTPSNPGGRIWTEEELKAVAEICRRQGVFVVSDEIHADLTFPGKRHLPWGKIAEDDQWAVLFSPSKTFNIPGLGTSFALIPNGEIRRKFQRKKYSSHGAMENPFGLVAAKAAYLKGAAWLDELREYLFGNYQLLQQHLPEKLIPAVQDGTYLAWINAQALGSSQEIKRFFFDQRGLGIQMGTDFGPGGEGFIRLNFALPRKKLEAVLEKINR